MTKKNLKPQQAAPVQREINTTSSVGGTGLAPSYFTPDEIVDRMRTPGGELPPFAGDDAE